MIYLKNKITGTIGKFACSQGEDYEECTQKEIDSLELEKEKIILIKIRKNYLLCNDWIISKISELSIQNQDISSLLTKYSEELTKRESARNQINEIESIENIENLEIYKTNFEV